jgi:hypothetical protein
MISKATDHKATVLMNRRMNTERRVATFGPVCSSVAGMALHHPEGRQGVQEGAHSGSDKCVTLSRVVIWSSLINPAMDCIRDERIIGESDRSSAHCHPKSKMGTVSDDVAGFTKCVAKRNFDCRHVRVYRGGLGASPDFR